ncbi:TPA: indoleacetamide hydrolase [Klebsiella variicola]
MRNLRLLLIFGSMTLPALTYAQPSLPDLSLLTASEAAKLICQRKITSEQLVHAYLDNIGKMKNLNAFITVNTESAIKNAKAWDKHISDGGACLPLGGVPVAIKDNIQVAGLPNTAGTPALKKFIPQHSAPVVQKLIDDGAIIIGKTNMHELAFGATGYNSAYHIPGIIGVRNAHDSDRIAGGSSSGNAVAIASGMSPVALGTDTGSSVRQPCALNGCVGFRPTTGRYSQQGITPISHTRDTAGPMGHTVEDVAFIDSLITGERIREPVNPHRIRLGVASYFWNEADDDVKQVTQSALDKLRKAGIEIIPIKMDGLEQANDAVSIPIVTYEGKYDLINYLKENNTHVTFNDIVSQISSPDVKAIFTNAISPQRILLSSGKTAPVYPLYQKAIKSGIGRLQGIYKLAFSENKIDAIIFPTSLIVAPIINKNISSPEMFAKLIHNTDPGSNARLPGLSIPAGFGPNTRMPVALEIDGLPGSDAQILAIGTTIEKIISH